MDSSISKTILIVEDNSDDAELFGLLLGHSDRDAKIIHAGSLTVAADAMRKVFVDCVVLDLGLPDSEGLKSVRVLQELSPQSAIVVVTGSSRVSAFDSINAGAEDHIVKGNTAPSDITDRINLAIIRHRVTLRFASLRKSVDEYAGEIFKSRERQDK